MLQKDTANQVIQMPVTRSQYYHLAIQLFITLPFYYDCFIVNDSHHFVFPGVLTDFTNQF